MKKSGRKSQRRNIPRFVLIEEAWKKAFFDNANLHFDNFWQEPEVKEKLKELLYVYHRAMEKDLLRTLNIREKSESDQA